MNAQIDKEAGLRSQIKMLKERIHSLDMTKVDPSELKAAIDSLKDLEARYSEQQEKRKKHLEEKAKALETKIEATPEETPGAISSKDELMRELMTPQKESSEPTPAPVPA